MNIPNEFLGNKREFENEYQLNKNRKEKNKEIYKQKLKDKKKKRKKDKKNNQKDNSDNNKKYLLELINNESQKKSNNSLKLEYQPLDENESLDKKKFYKKQDNNNEMQKVLDLFEQKVEKQYKKTEKLIKDEPQIKAENIQKEKNKDSEDSSSEDENKIIEESRKKKKKIIKEQGQSLLADLKSKAPYPEVVEPWDTNANDPELLIHFKCMPNTVPVPIHWAQNGKYLQSQRGKVRKPYKLPDYIEATGISRIRLIELPVHI